MSPAHVLDVKKRQPVPDHIGDIVGLQVAPLGIMGMPQARNQKRMKGFMDDWEKAFGEATWPKEGG